MSLPAAEGSVRGSLGRLALRSLKTACGCAARSWGMVFERNLARVTLRAEVRSR
jgi:hypothetical protein